MKGASRTFAPATLAPQRHLLSRSRSSSNQSQNSLYVSPSPTHMSPFTSAPSPSLGLAPTPASMRGASFGIPSNGKSNAVNPNREYMIIPTSLVRSSQQ
jgi:hypothetical protein